MALLQKTWSEIYNSRPLPVLPLLRTYMGAYASPSFLLYFKEGLKNAPSPWTVLASSNMSVVSTDDNWTQPSDVTRHGSVNDTWPASWILLKSSTTPPIYLIIDYTTVSSYWVTLRWSESQPDISNLDLYRTPEATGPEIKKDWYIAEPYSGSYEYYISMLGAMDGSFIVIGTMTGSDEANVLMFNRIRDASPKDPYPWVVWIKGNSTPRDVFFLPNQAANNDVFSFAVDGEPVDCSFVFPAKMSGASTVTPLSNYSADDSLRNWRPFSWPVRIIIRTTGYRGFKGYLEDFWWAAAEGSGSRDNLRWMQPGYEGTDMVVMRRGSWWIPCPGTPFKW